MGSTTTRASLDEYFVPTNHLFPQELSDQIAMLVHVAHHFDRIDKFPRRRRSAGNAFHSDHNIFLGLTREKPTIGQSCGDLSNSDILGPATARRTVPHSPKKVCCIVRHELTRRQNRRQAAQKGAILPACSHNSVWLWPVFGSSPNASKR